MVLTASELAGLGVAAGMLDRADALDRAVGANVIVSGSTGQRSVHPDPREARHHRSAAAVIVARIKLDAPRQGTRGLNRRRRGQLADARRERWPVANA